MRNLKWEDVILVLFFKERGHFPNVSLLKILFKGYYYVNWVPLPHKIQCLKGFLIFFYYNRNSTLNYSKVDEKFGHKTYWVEEKDSNYGNHRLQYSKKLYASMHVACESTPFLLRRWFNFKHISVHGYLEICTKFQHREIF